MLCTTRRACWAASRDVPLDVWTSRIVTNRHESSRFHIHIVHIVHIPSAMPWNMWKKMSIETTHPTCASDPRVSQSLVPRAWPCTAPNQLLPAMRKMLYVKPQRDANRVHQAYRSPTTCSNSEVVSVVVSVLFAPKNQALNTLSNIS